MERGPYLNIEEQQEALRMRFVEAVGASGIERRSVEPNHLPNPRIDLLGVSTSEMFIIMIEGIQRYKTVIDRATADRTLADIVFTADCLAATLPGNDLAVWFVSDAKEYLEEAKPYLARDVKKLMDAADEREKRRDAFYKKWRTAQSRAEFYTD